MDPRPAVAAYAAAWLETDPARRLAHLEDAWTEQGVYCDPLDLVTGREALSDHIGATQAGLDGGAIAVTSDPVAHHDSVFFRWTMTDASGATSLTGWDVAQLDDGGRITRLTGFFDPDTDRR